MHHADRGDHRPAHRLRESNHDNLELTKVVDGGLVKVACFLSDITKRRSYRPELNEDLIRC